MIYFVIIAGVNTFFHEQWLLAKEPHLGYNREVRGYSIVVIRDLPKVKRRVRFPLPAQVNHCQ